MSTSVQSAQEPTTRDVSTFLPPDRKSCDAVFQHPFTMMISGPTACGKTTMVKDMLQNSSKIEPGLQRIVWLYKRWQPMYTVIKRTVVPKVEFIQGIPSDLDDDDYFDPSINNLLILDDLFTEAGKDKRITDLFTEGSHHRSLSVISINQNLFGNRNPTQRRNCHYLILFNNPVDKQSVMTLARQMYPGETDKFMKMFVKATKNPYGYLLLDLKPFTPENKRLKCIDRCIDQPTNQSDHVTQQKPSKEDVLPDRHHSSTGLQSVHIDNNDNNMDKANACDDCGLLFDSIHDVQRHVKNWCQENGRNNKRKSDSESEPDLKRMRVQDSDEEDDNEEGFINLWKTVKSRGEDKYQQLYDQYTANGENDHDAQEMADERMATYNRRKFGDLYSSFLTCYFFPLKNNGLHRQIVSDIDKLHTKGVSVTTAVKGVLRKYRHQLQDLCDGFANDEDSDDSDASDEEEE